MVPKNGELERMLVNFSKLNNLTGFKFVIALTKNKELIKKEIEVLNKIKEESKEFEELRKKFQERQLFYADKDENGNPKFEDAPLPNGQMGRKIVMSKPKEEKLSKEIKKLEKDNQDLLKQQNEKEEEFLKALGEDCAINFVKIKEGDIPTEITAEQLDIISFMVDLK